MLRNQNAGCTIDRLGLLGAALLTLSACAATVPVESSVPVLGAATVPELSRLMEAGRLSSEALVAHCLDRIERLDPELRALIAINPEALPTARALDAERAGGRIRGPLHGIPVVLKDNIESADPLATTAGSLALKDNATGRDAPLVANLRLAGAVILGKANLSEWANFRSSRSSSGWSAIGGQTRNPYDPARSPCGSSSGSAVAVAAGLTALAVGTETNGSIVCPASANGIVGIKPSVGLVSRGRVIPISHTQDTAGPMARSVAGAAILLTAMAGPDEDDPASAAFTERTPVDYARHLDPDGLSGRRIGVVRSAAGFHDAVDALLEQAIADLRGAGATVIDDLGFEPPDDLWALEMTVLKTEFKHGLNAYFATLLGDLGKFTLERLVEFNRAHADSELHWFGQDILEQAEQSAGLDDPSYRDALGRLLEATRSNGIDRLLAEHQLDALIAPSGSPAWTIDLINGDHFIGGSSSYPAIAGYPNVTVPMGFVHGLPVGISFFGAFAAEARLIEIAYAYEQATRHRRPPGR